MRRYSIELFCFDAEISEEEYRWIDINRLSIPLDLFQKLVETGIIEARGTQIRSDQVHRIFKVLRLRRTLGINLTGAAVILELLEEIERLKDQNQRLQKEGE